MLTDSLVTMEEQLRAALGEIQERGNYREVKYVKPLPGSRILFRGKEYLNFCSNGYLSMHEHPEVIRAAAEAAREYGAGTCSSRSVSGSIDLYERLEESMARFKGYERALMFTSGYMANIGIVNTLTGEGDVIFSDALNHSSIVDSTRLSRARKVLYRHLDMDDLERRIRRDRSKGNRFVITETVFSMDGDVAPLDRLLEIKRKYGVVVIIDEAHATGVFGERGIGVEEVYNLRGRMDVQMASMGKSLGSFGAVALSNGTIREYLINRARTFMYTTALPPPVIAAALKALELISADRSYRDRLWANVGYLRQGLIDTGFDLARSEGPIVPIVVGDDKKAVLMQNLLLEEGIFLQAIRPPTVPPGTSRLRLNVVRAFTGADLDRVLDALRHVARKVNFF